MIFQFFNLLDDLTVLDNVLLPAQLAGMGKGEARRRAANCSARWASTGTPRPTRSGCPAASGSAWRWPGP